MSNDDARHAALMTILENGGNVEPETTFNLVNYESFTGLPRNDASLSEPEYLSVTDLNTKYMETLLTPAIPGVAIAVLLFLVCFLVVFLRVCTKCCAMCCPGSCWDRNCFRPQEYNDRKLKITKWAMLIFCIIGGIGCMLVFSQGTELSKGVGDFADELVNTAQSFENTVNNWYNTVQEMQSSMPSNDLGNLQNEGVSIMGDVINLNSDIKNVADKIELSFMIAAGVIFAVAIIATVFVCLGWSTVLMLFFFTLSFVMIVCWIVFGALGSIGTFLDDVSLGFEAFAADPTIKNAFPTAQPLCPNRHDAVASVNEKLRFEIHVVVGDLVRFGISPNLCPNCDPISHVYRKVSVIDYCEWYKKENDKSDISYADPLCRNHYFDAKKYDGDAYIPKSIDTNTNEIDPTLGGGQFTQCDYTSIDIQNGSTCGQNEVASDFYDEFERIFDILSKWISLVDPINDFITCRFVQSETADITATLTTVVDALKILWGGFLMLGMSYFSLWVILLVAVSRLANPQLNVDSDEYDPMWAERLSMPRER